MGIRFPLQTVLDYDDANNVGATSVAGGVAKTFTLPQDTDEVIVKLTSSIVGGTGVSATLQTTDDGGSTWYDVARSENSLLSNSTVAKWIAAPVVGMGIKSTITPAAVSVLGTTGSAAASTLSAGTVSGLPILSTAGRIFIQYTGNVTTNNGARVQVRVNSQSKGV